LFGQIKKIDAPMVAQTQMAQEATDGDKNE
jgi:hypothetical protein